MATSAQRKRHINEIRRQRYINGTEVTKENVAEFMNQAPRVVDSKVKSNQEKAKSVGIFDLLRLAPVLIALVWIVAGYIGTTTRLTIATKQVSKLESQLNTMRMENNEELQRIEATVNLEEIKRIAVEELGMTYATDGQVVIISDEGSDYVRQIEELPQN